MRPGQPAELHRLKHSRELVSGAAWLLDNWPANFDGMLTRYERAGANTSSLQQAFSPLYRVIYVELSEECFKFLRDAFEAHLHEHWWGLVCRRNRRLDRRTVETHPRMGLKQAASAAGLAPAVVRHLVQTELVPSITVDRPGMRRAATVNSADLAPLQALCGDAVNLSDAARRLALSEARLRQFVEAGLIKPLVSRGGASRSARWLFAQQELARLNVQGPCEGLPLRHVLRYAHLTPAELVALVSAVVEGSFGGGATHLSEKSPLGEVRVPHALLQAWLSERRSNGHQGMSIDAAAKLLGIKQQVAYCLVGRGLLGSSDGGRFGRRVMPEHLKLFSESYVSLAELASTRSLSPRAMLAQISAAPVSGPDIDGNRQIFFRRLEACSSELPAAAAGGA
jgi:hypothetical protein